MLYGEGVTYWAVAEMVKAQAGVLETDSAEDAAAKLEQAVQSAVGGENRWVLPNVRPLVRLGDASEVSQDHQAEAFAAWRRLFEGLAEEHPLVLVFEDLHWAGRRSVGLPRPHLERTTLQYLRHGCRSFMAAAGIPKERAEAASLSAIG